MYIISYFYKAFFYTRHAFYSLQLQFVGDPLKREPHVFLIAGIDCCAPLSWHGENLCEGEVRCLFNSFIFYGFHYFLTDVIEAENHKIMYLKPNQIST